MTTTEQVAIAAWTCSRCKMTVRWMAGHERGDFPATWVKEGDLHYCLTCQRALAAEAGAENAPPGTTSEARAKLRSAALVEFEILRDPDRPDGAIARAIRTSVPAVGKARKRLRGDAS